jgi:hypothetical protein
VGSYQVCSTELMGVFCEQCSVEQVGAVQRGLECMVRTVGCVADLIWCSSNTRAY